MTAPQPGKNEGVMGTQSEASLKAATCALLVPRSLTLVARQVEEIHRVRNEVDGDKSVMHQLGAGLGDAIAETNFDGLLEG